MVRPAKPLTPENYAKSGSEHAAQVALFMWAAQPEVRAKFPKLKYLYAIPNGGQRNKIVAARLKAEGVKKGMLDVCLPVARHGVHGLYLELKRPDSEGRKRGRPSQDQVDWIADLRAEGYGAATVVGFEAARDMLIQYLS